MEFGMHGYVSRSCVIITFMNILVQYVQSSSECPKLCQCSPNGSVTKTYQVVECRQKGLHELPQIPENSSSLNCSHNNIQELRIYQHFMITSNCYKLIKSLDISFNKLNFIESDFFKKFPKLESLNLSGNNLKEVAFFLPETLKVLEINSNYLTSVKYFGNLPLLQALYLAKNFISDFDVLVPPKWSENQPSREILPMLEILDLSENKIFQISPLFLKLITHLKYLKLSRNSLLQLDVFSYIQEKSHLEFLDLSHNMISSINSGALKSWNKLKYLSFSNNFLSSIPHNLPNVEWLDLSHNKISSASESESSIYIHDVLLMGGNPLHCDCELQWLKDFFNTRKYLLKYIDVNAEKFVPICATPEAVAGKSWEELSSEEFHCSKKRAVEETFSEEVSNDREQNTHITLYVASIGTDFVTLQWKNSGNAIYKTRIRYHVFQQENKVFEVQLSNKKTSYTVHHLAPSTLYWICVMIFGEGNKRYGESCVEAKTKEEKPTHLFHPTGWIVTCIFMSAFIAMLIILVVRCWRQTNLVFQTPRHLIIGDNIKKRQ